MAKVIGISGKKQSGKTSLAYYLKAKLIKKAHFYADYATCDIIQNEEGEVFFQFPEDSGRAPVEVKDIENPIVEVYSFGDALKETCMNTFGLSWEQCYGTDDQKNTFTKYMWDNLPVYISQKYSSEKREKMPVPMMEYTPPEYYQETIPRSGPMTAREIMQVFGTDIAREMFDDNIWVSATLAKIDRDNVETAIIADVRFPSEIAGVQSISDHKFIRLGRVKDISDNHPSETSLDDFSWDTLGENVLVVDNDGMTMEDKNKIVYDWLVN